MSVKVTLTFVQIMLAARQEARRLNQADLGVEHVFMALCRLDGFTENLLHRQGLDPRAVRRAVYHAVNHSTAVKPDQGIHFSPQLHAILDSISPTAADAMTADIPEPELLKAIIREDKSIPMQVLRKLGVDLAEVLARHEDQDAEEKTAAATISDKPESTNYKQLLRFGRDLTQLALDGAIHPAIGRDDEMRHLEQSLLRATKSNPVLIGEAGVGKTAIVEGLAYRIAHDQVIPELRGKHIIEINLAQVTAGTKYRGAFEENLGTIIDAAQKSPDIILAIDELHTIVGTGGPQGGLDASNIMKPVLARGEIQLIGATTREEYRKYIEPDAALERRFQPITVEEPGVEETLAILSGLRERLEAHHHATIEADALHSAVELSARFLPTRRLPDKALDLLDEACAYARVNAQIPTEDVEPAPPVQVAVEHVTAALTEWTGLPISELSGEQRQRLIEMPAALTQRVIGQENAVHVVTRAIETALTGLRRGDRPIAVLLFVGPTGVGKTELARALTQFLFGSEKEMIRLDMSEYQERHQVAKLIGAPPGYIGHEEAGQLTESLRNKPYSVVLLDEVEKAHPDVFDVFLQLFDDGRLTDAHGRTADGTSAIFIMTSNLGSGLYETGHDIGFTPQEDNKVHREEILRECKDFFRPEFINRIDEIVVFEPLARHDLGKIVEKLFAELLAELNPQEITLSLAPDVIPFLAEEGYEPMYGARPLRRTFERLLVQPLAHRIVASEFSAGDRVHVTTQDGQIVFRKAPAPE